MYKRKHHIHMTCIKQNGKRKLSTADTLICPVLQQLRELKAYLHIVREGISYASLVECLRCTNMHAPCLNQYHLKYFSCFSFQNHYLHAFCLIKLISILIFPFPSFIFKIQLGLGLDAHTHPHTHTLHKEDSGQVRQAIPSSDPVPLGPWSG